MAVVLGLFAGISIILFGNVLTATINSSGSNPQFSYNPKDPLGPDRWFTIWPTCKGSNQSPINIDTTRAIVNQSMQVQYRSGAGPLPGRLRNNGHVPEFGFKPSAVRPVLTGVPHNEADDYILEQFHLHFHDNSKTGSEHSVNGKFSSGEFHLVHYKKKYGSFQKALEKPDGLAVVAVFVEVQGRPSNLHIRKLVDETEETIRFGETLCLTLHPTEFIPANQNFYTYRGSLTTPACQESVTWIVLTTPISLRESDMAQLREMRDKKGVPISRFGNCRPQFPLGKRVLKANFISAK